jgi:hypothetical protein
MVPTAARAASARSADPRSSAWIASLCAGLFAAASGCSCGGAPAPPDAPRPEAPAPPRDPEPAAPAPTASAGVHFLKGQLHAHSNGSGDSETPPEEVAAWYARRGYDFLVFTDHNRVTDTPDPPGLLTLPGVELTQNLRTCDPPPDPGLVCLLHINALFVSRGSSGRVAADAPGPRRADVYQRGLEVALDLGAIAQLNHPNLQYGADADVLVALAQNGLTLVEIANQAYDSANEGDPRHPSTEAIWDQALTRGARVFATATDDAHHYEDAPAARARGEMVFVGDLGFVMVRAEKTPAAIRAALETGDFYSSTGVLLDRLEMAPEGIAVDVRGGDARTSFEVIGTGGAVLQRTSGGSLRFDPRTAPPGYVRVRIRDGEGRQAWTQPVWPKAARQGP